MGRKGTSKHKSSKTKNAPVINRGAKGDVSNFGKSAGIASPVVINKGEAISIGSSGKMKPSNSQRNSNKR